jgi:hypothetical protein
LWLGSEMVTGGGEVAMRDPPLFRRAELGRDNEEKDLVGGEAGVSDGFAGMGGLTGSGRKM